MSSSLFSVMAQSNAGSDWNWLLIFIIFVVVLVVAMVVQARLSTQEAEELAQDLHHDDETQHVPADMDSSATVSAEPASISETEAETPLAAETAASAPDD